MPGHGGCEEEMEADAAHDRAAVWGEEKMEADAPGRQISEV